MLESIDHERVLPSGVFMKSELLTPVENNAGADMVHASSPIDC